MDVDQQAPAIARAEVAIAAPPEVVFDVLGDVPRWTDWNPEITRVVVDGPVRVGATFRWGSGRLSIISKLEVLDRPTQIAWTGTTMGIRAVHTFDFERDGDGTRARSQESWRGFLPSLLRGYSRKTLDRGLRSFLGHLKVEAERRADS